MFICGCEPNERSPREEFPAGTEQPAAEVTGFFVLLSPIADVFALALLLVVIVNAIFFFLIQARGFEEAPRLAAEELHKLRHVAREACRQVGRARADGGA